jgi:uracil-DNA glycosylase
MLAQDPYIANEADGLAFSSGNGTTPYSLKIIFESLRRCGFDRTRVTLDDWAAQGVLLLNHALTTVLGKSNAHMDWGWHRITNRILRSCYERAVRNHQPTVFMAFGTYAQKAMQRQGIRSGLDVRYLESAHPAAVRYGYVFTGHLLFPECNKFLEINGQKPIQWGD